MSQVTSHQLQLQQEADKKAQQAAAEEAAKAKKKVVSEDAYSQMVDTQNVNRNANDVEARSVTEALSALGVRRKRTSILSGTSPVIHDMQSCCYVGKHLCAVLSCQAWAKFNICAIYMLGHKHMHMYACYAPSFAVLVCVVLQANEGRVCSV